MVHRLLMIFQIMCGIISTEGISITMEGLMKKILILALTICISFSFYGCNSILDYSNDFQASTIKYYYDIYLSFCENDSIFGIVNTKKSLKTVESLFNNDFNKIKELVKSDSENIFFDSYVAPCNDAYEFVLESHQTEDVKAFITQANNLLEQIKSHKFNGDSGYKLSDLKSIILTDEDIDQKTCILSANIALENSFSNYNSAISNYGYSLKAWAGDCTTFNVSSLDEIGAGKLYASYAQNQLNNYSIGYDSMPLNNFVKESASALVSALENISKEEADVIVNNLSSSYNDSYSDYIMMPNYNYYFEHDHTVLSSLEIDTIWFKAVYRGNIDNPQFDESIYNSYSNSSLKSLSKDSNVVITGTVESGGDNFGGNYFYKVVNDYGSYQVFCERNYFGSVVTEGQTYNFYGKSTDADYDFYGAIKCEYVTPI